MIDDAEVAAEISKRVLEASRLMNECVLVAVDRCSPSEFYDLKQAAGRVMAEVLFAFLNPLYRQHPQLKPPQWD